MTEAVETDELIDCDPLPRLITEGLRERDSLGRIEEELDSSIEDTVGALRSTEGLGVGFVVSLE